LCDNLDNDCDGMIDNGFGTVTCGVGACERTIPDCPGAVCTPSAPTVEICDNLDNDCDGTVDGFVTGPCGVGECQTTGICTAGVDDCTPLAPSTEICDSLDNDCDGVIDHFDNGSCGIGECLQIGFCSFGITTCFPGPPSPEVICDGLDNDCDGQVDEGPGPDLDGDGVPDQCDLDDGFFFLMLPGDGTVTWQMESGFTSFNLYRADLSVLLQSGIYTQDPLVVPLAGQACDLPIPSGNSGPDPPGGQALVYFVTGNIGMVEESLGLTSAGAIRPNDNPCP
jgi:hypothetical protein